MSPRFHALTELAVMDLDTLDLKNCCSEFDIDGDCCSCCKSALPVDGFRHMLEQNQGYLNSDLAALKKKKKEKDGCSLFNTWLLQRQLSV